MKKQKKDKNRLNSRVVVYAATSERVVLFVHAPQAKRLLDSKRAEVAGRDRRGIIAVRLLESAQKMEQLDARPGSFGIERQHLSNGAIVFKHRKIHDGLAKRRLVY